MTSQDKGSKGGFPIRRFLDQSSFAAPQDLSQRTTSFIASQRQGIHQMLLRHLITLMINVRSAKTGHDLQERPVFNASHVEDDFCLPSISDAHGCGPWLVRRTRLPAGRICRLFTISNIRAAHPTGEGTNLFDFQIHRRIGGACRDRTDDLKLAKLPLSQLS